MQGVKSRLQQQTALFLQLAFNADLVPDLQWNSDNNGSRQADKQLHIPEVGVQPKETARVQIVENAAPKLHRGNQDEQQNLTIELRSLEVASHPAINTEVDERRERPDVLGRRDTPERPRNRGDRQIDGQGQVFAMRKRRQRHPRRASHRRKRTHQNTQQNRRLEGDIRGKEVGDAHPHKHPKRQRNTDQGHKLRRLPEAAMRQQQKVAEGSGSGQRTRDRRRDAQLNQQRDQKERVCNRLHTSTVTPAGSW